MALMSNISYLGPAIAERLKDGSTPVRLSAERCSLHVFQLTKGTSFEMPGLFFQVLVEGLDYD